ncbi:MAG: ABC transporter permease [Flavobacteriaceae bacterium]|jgi:putative ABC transport system permease protein|nr:ABC transporter permease [Flavobacteriaceae bacterium]
MNIIFKRDTWQEIYNSLRNNKLRTFLTMVGVSWGMFLYVSLLGAAKGLEHGFNRAFAGFATNSIFLWAQQTSIPYAGFPNGRRMQLHTDDMDYLMSKVPDLKLISPTNSRGNVDGNSGELISRNSLSNIYSVNGVFPVNNQISQKKLLFGRFINDADISGSKNVVVIGEEVYKKLFDSKKHENPVGKSVSLKGIFFTVIGVFSVGKFGGVEDDQMVFIPFTAFNKLYNTGNEVGYFALVAKDNTDVLLVETDVKTALKAKYQASPEDTNAFGSFNLGDAFKKMTGFLTGIQFLTISVGVLTILAGVIAISNILLITVKERTKEIGIRRAIGAKPSAVRNQILLESVVITLSSGLMGFSSGIFLLMIIDAATKNQDTFPFYNPTVDYGNVFAAMAIMVILGLIIGMIPAQRAVKIRPIEALRTE